MTFVHMIVHTITTMIFVHMTHPPCPLLCLPLHGALWPHPPRTHAGL